MLIRGACLLFFASICALGFESANTQAFVGKWRADLDKSVIESGPKPGALEIVIDLPEERLAIHKDQTMGPRKMSRTYKLPLIDRESTVTLPMGILEKWQTISRDASSIEAEARIVQADTEIGWRRVVLRISADGNQLSADFESGSSGGSRSTDRIVLTRVKEKQ